METMEISVLAYDGEMLVGNYPNMEIARRMKPNHRYAIKQTVTVDMPKDGILNRPIGEGIEIKEIMKEVASHYIIRALKQSGGKKIDASKLLGLGSYQTLDNWMTKYKVTYGRKNDE